MKNIILASNLEQLQKKNRLLYELVIKTKANRQYDDIKISKTGFFVPCSENGIAYNSLYEPQKEAKILIDTIKPRSFLFFAGIGGAFHIREFLLRHPDSKCIISESSIESFRALLELIDISDIIANQRVRFIPDCTDTMLINELPKWYLPAIHGNFQLLSLRSWQEINQEKNTILVKHIQQALHTISVDFSVHAHFGRIWLRNSILNLYTIQKGQCREPMLNIKKKAVITAAGPSLKNHIAELKKNRDKYVIFTTDTAYSTLLKSGINPDVFISIDTQSISVQHIMQHFNKDMVVILDICGNNRIARHAIECGASLIFAAGGHPFAQYAAVFSTLPLLNTNSGTVTIAALDAAYALGFKSVQVFGSDYAYLQGKPYVQGTYLETSFGMKSNRYTPEESLYCTLMFRTPVLRKIIPEGITYIPETLQRYSDFQREYRPLNHWTSQSFKTFLTSEFIKEYKNKLELLKINIDENNSELITLLPFFAWYFENTNRLNCQKDLKEAIQLALDLIAGYTI